MYEHLFRITKVYLLLMLTLQSCVLVGQKQMNLKIIHLTNHDNRLMEDDIILKMDSSKVREYLNDHLIKVLSKPIR